ncbi:MAG: TniQ family protein [Nitrospirota bacterium]|nr:TniQ family protein [Nitrospirota bacterium]
MGCQEIYELVGTDPSAVIPQRSVLASLKPLGAGTPHCESLRSYYLTLAHMHHVSPRIMAKDIIIPRLGLERFGHNFQEWNLPLFNGIGAVPEKWAELLSSLTGQAGLDDLTLTALRPYTSTKRLMIDMKRWCPLCFSEAARDGRVYGHLLWEIAAVSVCPKHGVNLVSNCICNNEDSQSNFSKVKPAKIYLPGICSSCGRPLVETSMNMTTAASQREIKRAQIVGDMLTDIERLKEGTNGIDVFLNNAVRYFAKGNATAFAKMLHIDKVSLHNWIHRTHLPSLYQIVEIALTFQCSMVDVMLGDRVAFGEITLDIQDRTQKPFRTNKRRKLSKNVVKRRLEALLTDIHPISLTSAVAKIGMGRRRLRRDYPDIERRILQRNQAYRTSKQKSMVEQRYDLFRQCAAKLMSEGIEPTTRLVGERLGGNLLIIKGKNKLACHAICEEVIRSSQEDRGRQR